MAKRTLLVVDRDPLARKLVTGRFAALGWRTRNAESAEEALAITRAEGVDVLTTEVALIDSSGQELVHAIRADRDPRVARTMVLFLSAMDRGDDVVDGLRSGADAYMGKPIDLDELEAQLDALVRRAGMRMR